MIGWLSQCVSGGPEVMPDPGSPFRIPDALAAIHAARLPRMGPHILTGPIAIEGAEAGDLLEVRIERSSPISTGSYPRVPAARRRATRRFPGTTRQPYRDRPGGGPVLATMGRDAATRSVFRDDGRRTAGYYGSLSSREPREHGGNLDNKELRAGSSLFLPVWVEGARFSVGDGHGRQGDGEVCVNALETGLTGTLSVRPSHGGRPGSQTLRPDARPPGLRWASMKTSTSP